MLVAPRSIGAARGKKTTPNCRWGVRWCLRREHSPSPRSPLVGQRVFSTPSQGVESWGGTPNISESGSDFDVETHPGHPARTDQNRASPLFPPVPTAAQHEPSYADATRKASRKNGGPVAEKGPVSGKRGPDEEETPEPPAILSDEEAEDAKVRAGTAFSVETMIESLPFEEKSRILGVAPLASSICVATAAGPGGAIVPIRARSQQEAVAPTLPFRFPVFHDDLRLARKLQ